MRAAHRVLPAAALLLALGAAAPADAARLKGVDVPDTVTVDGHTLELQGVGLRKKFIFSVYVGALYLTHPTSDADRALTADEPKRIALHFLRDVPSESLVEAYEEGFFNNAQERLDRLRPRIDRFLSLHDGKVRKGQVLSYTYLPSVGTRVRVDGEDRGVVEGKDFMEALFAIWLGAVPPSHDLKRGMLGETP